MGSVGRKTPIELKLYLLSLALGILNHDKILYAFFIYNMSDKIRRMSMNVIF
jgi:hypothetical protein